MAKEKLIIHKLGFKIFFKKTTINNGVFIKFNFKAGSFNNFDKPGVAHFAEHCIAFGSEKWPKEDFKKFRNTLANWNFSTGPENMWFWAYCSTKDLEKVIESYSEAIGKTCISQENFDIEKDVIIQEVTYRQNNIGIDLYCAMLETLIKNKKIVKGMKIIGLGDPSDIKEITLEEVKEFCNKFFKLENLEIVCAGNVSKAKFLKYIEKYVVKNIQGGFNEKPVCDPALIWPKPSLILKPSSQNQKSVVRLLYKIPDLQVNNTLHSRIIAVLNESMYGTCSEIFRAKYGLCYACSSKIYNFENQYYLFIDVDCDENQVKDVLKRAPEYINYLREKTLTEERKREILEIIDKINDVNTPHPRNFENVNGFYQRFGRLASKKLKKKNNKLIKSYPAEKINNILQKAINSKPQVIIVSNVEKSKLPTYEKIASSLEKQTKASVKTTAKRKTTKINQENNEN